MKREGLAEQLKGEIPTLRRFASSLVGSYNDAEDLAQDTIERAILKAELFDGVSLRPWLFTICRRLFLNQRRQKNSRGVHTSIDDAPDSALRVKSNQETELDYERVLDHLGHLPASDRQLLSMIAFDGASYEEAARAIGTPVGTVRSRLSRARARLRAATGSGAGAVAHH